jgi:hypothetical protein
MVNFHHGGATANEKWALYEHPSPRHAAPYRLEVRSIGIPTMLKIKHRTVDAVR